MEQEKTAGTAASPHPDVRVRLVGAEPFFGPGAAQLLGSVKQYGSVYRACEHLGLSYSKGRRMLRAMEQELGQPAVLCTKGGAGGGSARLTAAGQHLLERYRCYEQSVRSYAEREFPYYFPPKETEP